MNNGNNTNNRQNNINSNIPLSTAPMATGSFTGASSSGRIRRLNEDAFYFEPLRGVEGNLFVLCDGMGGHKAGDIASKHAVKRINEYFYKSQNPNIALRLKEAIFKINSEIYSEANRDQAKSGMGTTLVAAFIAAGKLYIANVGDSRAYIFRDGKINKLTKDHSLIEEKLDRGEITQVEARGHPEKNKITRCIGYGSEVEVDIFNYSIKNGDRLLLCSDGLWDELDDNEIASILYEGKDVNDCVARLITSANIKGGRDNITCIVIDYGKYVKSRSLISEHVLPGNYISLYYYAKLKNKLIALYLVISLLVLSVIGEGVWLFWDKFKNTTVVPTEISEQSSTKVINNDTRVTTDVNTTLVNEPKDAVSSNIKIEFDKQPQTEIKLKIGDKNLISIDPDILDLSPSITIIDKIVDGDKIYVFLFDKEKGKLFYFDSKNSSDPSLDAINLIDDKDNAIINILSIYYAKDKEELVLFAEKELKEHGKSEKIFCRFNLVTSLNQIKNNNSVEFELIDHNTVKEGLECFSYFPESKENPIRTFSISIDQELIMDDNIKITDLNKVVAGKVLSLANNRICLLAKYNNEYKLIIYNLGDNEVTEIPFTNKAINTKDNVEIVYFLLYYTDNQNIFNLLLVDKNMQMENFKIVINERKGTVSYNYFNIEDALMLQLNENRIKSFLTDFNVFNDNIADLNIMYLVEDNSFKSFYLSKKQEDISTTTTKVPESTTTTKVPEATTTAAIGSIAQGVKKPATN